MFNILNIELTSLCNKNCYMCGRRDVDKYYKEYSEFAIKYGNISMETLRYIHNDLSENILIQFHNNGEPLLYPKLKKALQLFNGHVRCLNTNGKLLVEKAEDIIENLETITISTFENDPDADEQLELVKEFLKIKGDRKPRVIIRCLGNTKHKEEYEKLGLLMVDRIFHSSMGSFKYTKQTTIPEHGICLEALMHPAINIKGDVSICVRFDPKREGVIGNVNKNTIIEIWNGEKRKKILQKHIEGKRNEIPLCTNCEFWGIPRG